MIAGGVIVLIIGALGLLLRRWGTRRRAFLAGTQEVGCGDLPQLQEAATAAAGKGMFELVCQLGGRLAPGPDGPLTSQFAEQPCVWYRSVVRRRYERHTRDSEGRERVETCTEQVSSFTSPEPFLIDDGSGTVRVVPAGAEMKGSTKVLDRFEEVAAARQGGLLRRVIGDALDHHDNHTLGYEYEEHVFAPGTTVCVVGRVHDRDGDLAVTDSAEAPLIVTTGTKNDLVTSAANAQKAGLVVAVLGFLGGVGLLVGGLLH